MNTHGAESYPESDRARRGNPADHLAALCRAAVAVVTTVARLMGIPAPRAEDGEVNVASESLRATE